MMMQSVHILETSLMAQDYSNREVFGEQIDAKLDHFYSAALRLTRNRADAEDLVAEAITRAWSSIHSLQDSERFVPWVLRIITNTFISEKRKAVNRMPHESYNEETDDETHFSLFEQLHQPFLLWWGNPEQEFLNNLLHEDIQKALDGIPDNYRIIVVLADMEGLTYQEIAESLDVPVGTVRSRLSRGRGMLQKTLWQHAEDRDMSQDSGQGEDSD